jgi:hypothetical protein
VPGLGVIAPIVGGLLFAIVELAATLPAPPDADQTRFSGWAERQAIAESAHLGALWTVELDGDPTEELAALLCVDEMNAVYLVEDPDTGARWRLAHPSWGHVAVCSRSTVPSWRHADDGLVLQQSAPGETEEIRVGIADDRLVELARSNASSGHASGYAVEEEIRWDLSTVGGRIVDINAHPQRTIEREGWIARVQSGTPTLTTAPAFVGSGREHWDGEADASLRIAATAAADGSITVHVAPVDDRRVLAPTARPEAGDHVELWWAPMVSDDSDPFGEHGSARGVAIDPVDGAPPRLRWITASRGPLPAVRGTFDRFEITLPAADVPSAAPRWTLPLSVVFVDVDDPKSTRATQIATSRFVAGQPGSFGRLVSPASAIAPTLAHRLP